MKVASLWADKWTCPGNLMLGVSIHYLLDLGTTNFNPLHISLTAHTFTSTNPFFNAKFRILPSVRSLGMPALFLYQETQMLMAGLDFANGKIFISDFSISVFFVTKR